jgi:hypothetical protein
MVRTLKRNLCWAEAQELLRTREVVFVGVLVCSMMCLAYTEDQQAIEYVDDCIGTYVEYCKTTDVTCHILCATLYLVLNVEPALCCPMSALNTSIVKLLRSSES